MKSNTQDTSTKLRDSLALSRTIMANERTLMSFIRTGLTCVVSGAGILRFIQDGLPVLLGGWSLIFIGICFFFGGFVNYIRLKNSLFVVEL